MKTLALFSILFICLSINAQDKKAYQIYTADGTKSSYQTFVESISKNDVIFFGELHNNPISHWLQFELTKDLYLKNTNLILGFEMFESDNQLIVDEYTQQIIPAKKFEADARLWNNYSTDYKALLDYASKNKLKVIASNIPRRYASLVAKKGLEILDTLSLDAKKFFSPLPIAYDPELSCYKKMLKMMHMPAMRGKSNENIPKAQAIKDATMAYFINSNFINGSKLIHFNGSYHSDFHEGIVWHLKKYEQNLKIITITTVLQEDLDKLADKNFNKADFIIVVPNSMTTTY